MLKSLTMAALVAASLAVSGTAQAQQTQMRAATDLTQYGTVVDIVNEDFSKFSAGSETAPTSMPTSTPLTQTRRFLTSRMLTPSTLLSHAGAPALPTPQEEPYAFIPPMKTTCRTSIRPSLTLRDTAD